MKHSSHSLALRDPALAALVGALPSAGDDYGFEPEGTSTRDFDTEFGDDFGGDDWGDDYGIDFGIDFGAETAMAAPAALAAAVPRPTQAQALQLWNAHHQKAARERHRMSLIEPNKGLSTKIERYAFAVNQALTLGVAAALTATNNPDVNIRPQRMTTNVPMPGMVTISEIKVANVSVSVGGILDAFDFNANGVGQTLDMPTLSPANRASLLGAYTGVIPPAFIGGATFLFVASFKGPATMAA